MLTKSRLSKASQKELEEINEKLGQLPNGESFEQAKKTLNLVEQSLDLIQESTKAQSRDLNQRSRRKAPVLINRGVKAARQFCEQYDADAEAYMNGSAKCLNLMPVSTGRGL